MSQLGNLDLDALTADTRGFLARVLQAGRAQDALPAGFDTALAAFLRAHAMAHARRHRTGLAIDRDALEPAVRQGYACVEAALQHDAGGDLRRALALLAEGDLESLRKRGWERLWHAVDEMRAEAASLRAHPTAPLLHDWRVDLERWAALVPESWMTTDDKGEPLRVEPAAEYAAYRTVARRGWFLHALPFSNVEPLLAAWPPRADFGRFLRQLAIALALGRLTLPVDADDVREFSRSCLLDGLLRPEVRDAVRSAVADAVSGSVPEARAEAWLPVADTGIVEADLDDALAYLEGGDDESRGRAVLL